MRPYLFLLAIAGVAIPAHASSSASSAQPPAALRQCLTQALGAAGMVLVVSPLPDDGFSIEAKPFKQGKSSSIVVNTDNQTSTIFAKSPKGVASPSEVDLAVKKCASN